MIVSFLGCVLAYALFGMGMKETLELYGDALGIVCLIVGLIILFCGSGRFAKTKNQNDCVFCLGLMALFAPFFLKLANRTEPLPELNFFKFILLFIAFIMIITGISNFYSIWWEPEWQETVQRRFFSRKSD